MELVHVQTSGIHIIQRDRDLGIGDTVITHLSAHKIEDLQAVGFVDAFIERKIDVGSGGVWIKMRHLTIGESRIAFVLRTNKTGEDERSC